MIGFVRSFPLRLGRAVRRRPRTTVLAVVAVVFAGGAAFYGYAVREWRQAVAAVRDARPSEARGRLNLCLKVWPNDPAVHRLAARAAWQTGDLKFAEEQLNQCLKLEHGASEDTQLEFLLMRTRTGELPEVVPLLYDFVARGHPDSVVILETIASAYMHDLQYHEAYLALSRWVLVAPNSPRAYNFRGWVLERLNQAAAAMDDYLKALELDPNLTVVRLRVAEMYLEDKDPVQALPHLEFLLAQDPNRPETRARLGQCRYLQGRPAEARQLLEGVVNELPNDTKVLLYLAKLDLDDGRADRAAEYLRRVLALEPSELEAKFVLITALRTQGRDAEADAELADYNRQRAELERVDSLLVAEAKAPSRDPQVAYEIGALLLRIHREPQGIHWLTEALERDPNHRPSHQLLADYFETHGEPERAAVHRKYLK
jgi:tetratricopeptide (TPR) repeat protein